MPGEHDVLNDDGKQYLERYGKGAKGAGWYSFEKKGVHFVGLVNVMNLKAGGLGTLGHEQLEWLEDDVTHLKSSTPIVVFAHIPLWTVYPEWGWGTEDSAQALAYLKKFGSVTVLNGHIHQTMQKVEGNVTFHTACFDGVSAAGAGHGAFAGTDESAGGAVAERAGDYGCECGARAARAGGGGFFAGLSLRDVGLSGECSNKCNLAPRAVEERFLRCVARLVRRSERGRKSRATPVGMTGLGGWLRWLPASDRRTEKELRPNFSQQISKC